MNEGLKQCPFCGTIPYLEKKPLWQSCNGSTHGYYGAYEFIIECKECGCRVNLGENHTIYIDEKTAKENAIKSWNNRV